MAYDKDEYFLEDDGSQNYDKKEDGSYKWGHNPSQVENQFTDGHNKSKGRPKGSKNKKTLREELADKGGLSPAELLYSVMNDENANMGQRMAAAKELLKYTETALSAVEVTGKLDVETQFMFVGEFLDANKEEEDDDGED